MDQQPPKGGIRRSSAALFGLLGSVASHEFSVFPSKGHSTAWSSHHLVMLTRTKALLLLAPTVLYFTFLLDSFVSSCLLSSLV